VPAEPVAAEAWLPPAARATVDGYAVRAIDTYGASETLPTFLELTGAVVMGGAGRGGRPGAAIAIPTAGCCRTARTPW
jgi:molybdopterin molybdotransferase